MAKSYESPPTDLMTRHAFEFPWTRRKRMLAWQEWTSQHLDSQPATSATTETASSQQGASTAVERAVGQDTQETVSKIELQGTVAPEDASEAVAAAARATVAAKIIDDPTLLAQALQQEASALQLAGDDAAAVSRYVQILTLADDPATRRRLDNPQAAQAIASAREKLPGLLSKTDPEVISIMPTLMRQHGQQRKQGEPSGQSPQPSGEQTKGVVAPGMQVTVQFQGDDDPVTFALKLPELSRPIGGEVYSPSSPLGNAIIGRKVGETATYMWADGQRRTIEILDVAPYEPRQPQVGERFLGTVAKTTTFGAFISLLPGKDGLLHINQIRKLHGGARIENVDDVIKVGDKIQVEISEVDDRGKLSLVPVEVVERDQAARSSQLRDENPPGEHPLRSRPSRDQAGGSPQRGDEGMPGS
jgi:predicted RNA-binding protein with RPS1 domain